MNPQDMIDELIKPAAALAYALLKTPLGRTSDVSTAIQRVLTLQSRPWLQKGQLTRVEIASVCADINLLVMMAGDLPEDDVSPDFYSLLGMAQYQLMRWWRVVSDGKYVFGLRASDDYGNQYFTHHQIPATAITSLVNQAYTACAHYLQDGIDRERTFIVGAPTHDYEDSPWSNRGHSFADDEDRDGEDVAEPTGVSEESSPDQI